MANKTYELYTKQITLVLQELKKQNQLKCITGNQNLSEFLPCLKSLGQLHTPFRLYGTQQFFEKVLTTIEHKEITV